VSLPIRLPAPLRRVFILRTLLAVARALDGQPSRAVEGEVPAAVVDLDALATALAPGQRRLADFRSATDLRAAMAARRRDGEVPVVLRDGPRIAACAWLRFRDASLPSYGIAVALEPEEAYLFALYTVPEVRGRGWAGAVLAQARAVAQHRGIRRLYAWVSAENAAARAVFARDGWVPVARLIRLDWRGHVRGPVALLRDWDPRDPLAGWCAPGRLRVEGTRLVRLRTRGAGRDV